MSASKGTLRNRNKGHKYYKSSDCPVCPICANENKPTDDFLSKLAAPARRALQNAEITSVRQLSKFSEPKILKLHGMGQTTIPKLRAVLKEKGLSFRKNSPQRTTE